MLKAYTLIATLQSFINDRFQDRKDRGATAVEYGLIVGLIAVVLIVAVGALGGHLQTLFEAIGDKLGGVAGDVTEES